MSDEEMIGMDTLEPDQFMGPRRFKITYRCRRCSHEYYRITTKVTDKDPPCPKKSCKAEVFREEVEKEAQRLAQMLEEQRPPAHTGANVNIRAVDATADIVMHDHNLTNLQDNIRHGEAMAPKLPPAMQTAADNFFNPQQAVNKRAQARIRGIGQRAIAGAFRSTAINPVQIVGGTPGETALRRVGIERLK